MVQPVFVFHLSVFIITSVHNIVTCVTLMELIS